MGSYVPNRVIQGYLGQTRSNGAKRGQTRPNGAKQGHTGPNRANRGKDDEICSNKDYLDFDNKNMILTFQDHHLSTTSPKSKSGLKFSTNLSLAKLNLILGEKKGIFRCRVAIVAKIAKKWPNMAKQKSIFLRVEVLPGDFT